MPGQETSNNPQQTAQTPSAAEKEAFIALFEQFYGPGGPLSRWGRDLKVLREAPNPRALAENHNGRHTREAMVKVRNAEAEAKSIAGHVQLDTPAQGDCLFWAVMLGALIRANGTDRFEAVVSDLFGKEPTPVDAKQLSGVLLPSYQGRVSDITGYDTTHTFHTWMMRFRGRVANHIKETSELHGSIADDATTYTDQISQAGTWGGEVEIKAMATLLGMDIIVHQCPGSPMRRLPAVEGRETEEVLHIAHVPASAGSSVRNHYRFYVPEAKITWSREVSAVEKAARDAYAEYQTWRLLSYPVMDSLGRLLHSRLANQPSDGQFDQQILWLLVTGNIDHLAESKSTSVESVADMFVDKFNRGDQGFFESSTGPDAQFPGSLRGLLGGLAIQVDKQIRPLPYIDINSMSYMLSFLTLKDQVALLQTCKSLHKDVGRKVRVNRLLSLVAQGRQPEAEVMIQKDPSLLLARGDVTDGAGRTFRHITALQYAVWALDAHMWTMMLPYFDRIDKRAEAGDQLRLLEEKGLGEHARHFDFKPLLDAYAAFLAHRSTENWCRGVGGQQRLLPDHMIREHTMPLPPFKPSPDFSVPRGHPRPHCELWGTWWGQGEYRGERMGAMWAAHKGNCYYCFNHLESVSNGAADKRAVMAMRKQRIKDLSDLLSAFSISPSQALEHKSPGRRG